ncbi:hypothetical protein CCHL11_07938 [Colletotrichum chlorophyti]|uniref:Uncharacterized protein n=1 Tax=Colletotrichum chlorophyti TaxID=708187 RepID=A0A1Q8S8E9_9PEZI|nr:hypothetical protein CCHL11_07938 [Colletotrichum chlorophyti]
MSSPDGNRDKSPSQQVTSFEGRTREEVISEIMKKNEGVQSSYPQVDFKGAVLEPTINLTFDIQEHVDEANQRRYNTLMSEMLEHTGEPAVAERLFWEARECLTGYPPVLAQFEAVFINHRSVQTMLRELDELMKIKMSEERRMSLQTPDSDGTYDAQ